MSLVSLNLYVAKMSEEEQRERQNRVNRDKMRKCSRKKMSKAEEEI
jgi:uncharacterized protein with FMN-binding domain